jgi:OPA family glycerol-3-phosphate transporter-like MFS transporter/OPA family sugar phosphate sensor protein UhpC-like MFS transporter
MKTKKSFQYWQWRVIICSMIGYSVFYFVRKNFAFAMPALGQEYGITDTSFGVILTLVGLVYGVSKFLNGFIADRANARWHLVIGLGACVILNFLFGWSADISHWITGQESGPDFVNAMVAVMAVLLVLNNVFQGAGFGPCNRLMVHWVPPKELATKMSIWNMSHSIGAAIVSIVCGSIVASMGWRWCFWIPAAIGAGGVAFIILTLRDTPSSVGLPELPDTKTELDDDDTKEGYRKFVMDKVFKNPVVWIIATTALMLYIVRFAVLDWGPKFLQQGEQQLSPQLAGWTIGIFEIAGCLGMLAAGWVTDHWFHSRGQQVCVIEMILTGVCLLAIHFLPAGTSPVVMLVLLALAGFFLYGPQALFAVISGNQVTKKAASAAAGFIGLFSYLSTLFTGAGVGLLSDRFGDAFWGNLFLIMAFIAIGGGLLIATLWNIKDDGYVHE